MEARLSETLHVVVPVYEAAATVERTVRSLAVIPPDRRGRVRVWAVDDGSTDGSGERCRAALGQLAWPGATVLRRDNGGSGAARNEALRAFGGGWVLLLDADDELAMDPTPILDAAGDATAVLLAVAIERAGRAAGIFAPRAAAPARLRETFSAGNPYPTPAVIFRRERLEALFDESLGYLEDWHFWAANPGLFARCAIHPEAVVARVHAGPGGKTGQQVRNGEARIAVADLLERTWGAGVSATVRNNLALQRAIGAIQAGRGRAWRRLATWPASPALYAKWLVYLFAYRAYLRFYPYA